VFIGLLPFSGGVMLFAAMIKSIIDDADPANTYTGTALFGLGLPVAVALVFTILGVVLLIAQRLRQPEFFRRRAEAFDPAARGPIATTEVS
jgi:hypothetical protein